MEMAQINPDPNSFPLQVNTVKVGFSVLSSKESNLSEEVKKAKSAGIDRIHVDYIDGKFTPGLTPFDSTNQISKIAIHDIPIEVHLMVDNPNERTIESLIRAGLKKGRDRINIHYEAFKGIDDLLLMFRFIHNQGFMAGLAINPETEIRTLKEPINLLRNYLDSVMVMSIIPGAGSRPFIEESTMKIKSIKKLLFSLGLYEKVKVISDGGLNEFSLKSIIEAGADELITRSWILREGAEFYDRLKTIRDLSKKFVESIQLKDMIKKWDLGVYKYLVDAIVSFCKGENIFAKEEIINSITHLKGVSSVRIDKNRVIDVWYNDKLLRFHKDSFTPIEHLGLKDSVRYDSISVKIYVGNVNNPVKGDYILGISGSWHDSTAALIKDGRIVAALEEERMSRIKHDTSLFPVKAIKKLFEYVGIGWENIKHISIGWNYNLYVDTPHSKNLNEEFFKKMDEEYCLKKGIEMNSLVRRDSCEKNKDRFDVGNVYSFLKEMKEYYKTLYEPRVSFVRHTKSHAASAYYLCGFSGKVLTVALDGYGDYETGSVWLGEDGEMKEVAQFNLPNSLGWVYATITEYLGFKPSFDEGQVMGFAPYGEPWNSREIDRVKAFQNLFKEHVYFDTEKQSLIVNPDLNYYGIMMEGTKRITKYLKDKLSDFGIPPRTNKDRELDPYNDKDRAYANLAYALQERTAQVLEEIVRFYLNGKNSGSKVDKLALAGGIALNILSNGKLITDGIIFGENLFVQPAAGDSGTSIGAALVVSKEIYHENVNHEMKHASYGPEYNNGEIESALINAGLKENIDYVKVEKGRLIDEASACIGKAKAIAWFQGRSEIGPRALGNRSILLNLNDVQANNTANIIKNRQPWRPSASSICEEDAKDYFRGIDKSPFMVVSFPILYGKQKVVLSGVHKFGDRLARPQTVSRKENPLYWELLKKIEEVMGIPAVVNTSFNKQEPLVENPEQAIKTFFRMESVDKLFIGNFIVNKKNPVLCSE